MGITYIKVKCKCCGKSVSKYIGHYNRTMKGTGNFFCNKKCAGKFKRTSIEEKKLVKKNYDIKYREDNLEYKKQWAKEYFQKDYAANPEKYKKERQRKYKYHLQYLQRPEYKECKKQYDKKHLAKKHYGEFAEAALILYELETELDSKQIKYDIEITQNKSTQKRKRKWQQLLKNQQQ